MSMRVVKKCQLERLEALVTLQQPYFERLACRALAVYVYGLASAHLVHVKSDVGASPTSLLANQSANFVDAFDILES